MFLVRTAVRCIVDCPHSCDHLCFGAFPSVCLVSLSCVFHWIIFYSLHWKISGSDFEISVYTLVFFTILIVSDMLGSIALHRDV